VKAILGVRETTRNDTILIETGMPSVKELIEQRTAKFAKKELLPDCCTPLSKIYKICETKRTSGFVFLSKMMNPSTNANDSLIEKFKQQTSTKATTYRDLNPDLSVHAVYTSNEYINERERFRLCSHHLKVETVS
jgi:hypothetical protein